LPWNAYHILEICIFKSFYNIKCSIKTFCIKIQNIYIVKDFFFSNDPVNSAVHNVQFSVVYSVNNVQCEQCTVWTLYSIQCEQGTVWTVYSVNSVWCPQCTVLSALFNLQFSVHVLRTVYKVQRFIVNTPLNHYLQYEW